MTRLEMINFINKYSRDNFDFTQYDNSDLLKLCHKLSLKDKLAEKELYANDWMFGWYWTLLSWMKDRNAFCRGLAFFMLLFFNPILIILYVSFGIVALLIFMQ